MLDWNDIEARGKQGIACNDAEALQVTMLTDEADLSRLYATAEAIKLHHKGREIYTCGITNAKSGLCPEKCNFCSQSAHFRTDSPKYALKDADTMAAEARKAADHGVREFSIVSQGRAMTKQSELDELKKAFTMIREETGMQTCASLGLMSKEHLSELKEAGMDACHHNLETARSFHHNIVESHSYDDEVETIKAAKEVGMYVCSGGIFGMGEDWGHRRELAEDLRSLDVDSVPINFLNPRPGTPMAGKKELTPTDCLKIIALYRLMLPTKDLIVCGGREMNLQDKQYEMFAAGANGIMLGNYLTTAGGELDEDLAAIEAQGLIIRPPPHTPNAPVQTS
jgi:biotin synthase